MARWSSQKVVFLYLFIFACPGSPGALTNGNKDGGVKGRFNITCHESNGAQKVEMYDNYFATHKSYWFSCIKEGGDIRVVLHSENEENELEGHQLRCYENALPTQPIAVQCERQRQRGLTAELGTKVNCLLHHNRDMPWFEAITTRDASITCAISGEKIKETFSFRVFGLGSANKVEPTAPGIMEGKGEPGTAHVSGRQADTAQQHGLTNLFRVCSFSWPLPIFLFMFYPFL
ncbi:hypothetical protein TRVL_02354 [Trypanosoma vivax]|nr:hypothetical protein TRVL_02354 [Trypanosoma vivax]